MADPGTALILLTENWSEARPDADGRTGALVVEIPGPGAVEAIDRARDADRAGFGCSIWSTEKVAAILGDPEALAAEVSRRAHHRAVEIADEAQPACGRHSGRRQTGE